MKKKPLPDQILLESIQNLAVEERFLRAAVLQLLHEVEERRLYSQLGHRSLFRFCQKELGLNEEESYQLVMGMRLRTPELKPPALPLSVSAGGARKPKRRQP